MRRQVAMVVLLIAASMPAVHGQDGSESDYVVMGTDPEGDIHGIAGDAGVVVVDNQWAPLDLISFSMGEDTTFGYHLQLQVESLDVTTPENPDADEDVDRIADDVTRSIDYTFEFQVRGQEFRLRTAYFDEPRDAQAFLQVLGPDRFWETLGEVPVTINEDLPGFEWRLSNDLLAGQDGVAPRIGDAFTEMRWESYSTGAAVVTLATYGLAQVFMDFYDYMPDGYNEYLSSTWDVQAGSISSGHIVAFSDLPVRVSNGEATTFVYEVDVTNNADHVDTVLPEWSGGADGWLVTFPDGKVRLDAGETKTIPFLVTVPFAHQHGVYWPFDVTFQSQADPEAAGRVELGVRYTAIPQPAGHHPSVYLHGTEQSGTPYFNTIQGEEYPEDPTESESIGGGSSGFQCSTGGYTSEVFRMSPSLRMGIDMDMDAIGEATLNVYSELGSSGDVLSGFFIVSKDRPEVCYREGIPEGAIASVDPTEPISVGRGQNDVVTTTITPLEHGDYLPLEPGANMWLLWSRSYSGSGGADPSAFGVIEVRDDSEFFLPISEYHDDVDDYFHRLTGIDLYATTDQERWVNPGKTVLHRIVAQNIGAVKSEFYLEVTGANTEWATLLGDLEHVKLKPGDAVEMILSVQAPSSAVDGELADITLVMSNSDDESVRSLIRLLTEVDTDDDHEDEGIQAALLDEELKESPGTSAVWPALVMVALALFLGRRRP